MVQIRFYVVSTCAMGIKFIVNNTRSHHIRDLELELIDNNKKLDIYNISMRATLVSIFIYDRMTLQLLNDNVDFFCYIQLYHCKMSFHNNIQKIILCFLYDLFLYLYLYYIIKVVAHSLLRFQFTVSIKIYILVK